MQKDHLADVGSKDVQLLNHSVHFTTLSGPAHKGDTVLKVVSSDSFLNGDEITVGYANAEKNAIIGFGSILLAHPLQNDHPKNTVVYVNNTATMAATPSGPVANTTTMAASSSGPSSTTTMAANPCGPVATTTTPANPCAPDITTAAPAVLAQLPRMPSFTDEVSFPPWAIFLVALSSTLFLVIRLARDRGTATPYTALSTAIPENHEADSDTGASRPSVDDAEAGLH